MTRAPCHDCHDINILTVLSLDMIWKSCNKVYFCFQVVKEAAIMNTCNEQSPRPKPQCDCTVTFSFLDGLWKTSSSPASTSFRTCSRLHVHGYTLIYLWLNCEKWLTSCERCLTFSSDLCWRLQKDWSCKMLVAIIVCLLPAIHDDQQWLNHHDKHFLWVSIDESCN